MSWWQQEAVSTGWIERQSAGAAWIHQIISQFSHFESFPRRRIMEAKSLVPFLIDFFGIRGEAGTRPRGKGNWSQGEFIKNQPTDDLI